MSIDIFVIVSVEIVMFWLDDVDVMVIGFGIVGGCVVVSVVVVGVWVLVFECVVVVGGIIVFVGGYFYLGGGIMV